LSAKVDLKAFGLADESPTAAPDATVNVQILDAST
jgi:hypothetical protein